jgi:outer membrane protein assembly factor BamB
MVTSRRASRFTRPALTFAVLALSAAASAAALASDWPQWRGPERTNISKETGLLDQWPDDGPKLVWKATGLGDGYAGVSVVAGRIYTMGEDATSSYVRALDEKSGKLLWSSKVGKPAGVQYPGPRATPTVDGDRVYAIGQNADLVCVTTDGKAVWRKNLRDDFHGKMMSDWGYAESPLVDGEQLVCTPGGKEGTILALNKMTGAPIWRSKQFSDTAAYSSIVPAEIGGKRQYVQLTGDSVAAVDAKTGDLLWRAERKGPTAVIPTPIVSGDHVFVTSGYNAGGDLFKISSDAGKFKADRVYHSKEFSVHVGGAVLVDGYLYGFNNTHLLCMDFLTGKVEWKNRSVGKGAVTYADKHIYARGDAQPGPIALIEANPKKYVEKGRFDQPDASGKNTWPPVVVANGKMYLRDQDVLLCYDVKK